MTQQHDTPLNLTRPDLPLPLPAPPCDSITTRFTSTAAFAAVTLVIAVATVHRPLRRPVHLRRCLPSQRQHLLPHSPSPPPTLTPTPTPTPTPKPTPPPPPPLPRRESSGIKTPTLFSCTPTLFFCTGCKFRAIRVSGHLISSCMVIFGDDGSAVPRRRRVGVGDYVKTAAKPFGRGSQGAVFKAKHRVTGEGAVIKTFKNVCTGSREAWALYRLQKYAHHKNIIGYKACSPCCKHIVLELAEGVEMLEVVQRHQGIDDLRARPVFAQMLAGVQHMHDAGLAHMDLKLENLILTKQGVAKWLDFGLSVMHKTKHENGSWEREAVPFSGSKAYCAPEVLVGLSEDGFCADVWSLGVCLFALSSSRFPFDAASETDLRYCAFLEAYRAGSSTLRAIYHDLDFPLSDDLADLIEGMLVVEPKHRFTLDQVRAHHWLRPRSV